MRQIRHVRLNIESHLGLGFIHKALSEQLKRFVRIAGTGNTHSLRSIEVELVNDPRSPVFSPDGLPQYLQYRSGEMLMAWAERNDRFEAALSAAHTTAAQHQRCLEPLANMFGLEHVIISGSVIEEFVQRLAEIMMSPEEQHLAKSQLVKMAYVDNTTLCKKKRRRGRKWIA